MAGTSPSRRGISIAAGLAIVLFVTQPVEAGDALAPKLRFARSVSAKTDRDAAASERKPETSVVDVSTESPEKKKKLRRGVRLRWRAPNRKSASTDVKRVSLSQSKKAEKPEVESSGRSFSRRADYVDDDAFDDPFGDLERVVQAQAETVSQPQADDPPIELPAPAEIPPLEEDPDDQLGIEPLEDVLRDSLAQRGQTDYCPSPDDLKRIYEITNDITPEAGEFPEECPLDSGPFLPRRWDHTTYTWKASGLCHKPLYFEERSLERYGHSWGPLLQPWMSAAHFFGTMPALPYAMGMNPPWECKYPLGYYRPGSCAPYLLYPIPISARGAVTAGAVWTGGVFLIP